MATPRTRSRSQSETSTNYFLPSLTDTAARQLCQIAAESRAEHRRRRAARLEASHLATIAASPATAPPSTFSTAPMSDSLQPHSSEMKQAATQPSAAQPTTPPGLNTQGSSYDSTFSDTKGKGKEVSRNDSAPLTQKDLTDALSPLHTLMANITTQLQGLSNITRKQNEMQDQMDTLNNRVVYLESRDPNAAVDTEVLDQVVQARLAELHPFGGNGSGGAGRPPKLPDLKPEHLTYFNPSKTKAQDWWRQVQAVRNAQLPRLRAWPQEVQAWDLLVLSLLPTCLQGKAKDRYVALPKAVHEALGTDMSTWVSKFVHHFSAPRRERQSAALKRKWEMDKESSEEYALAKIALLRDVDALISDDDLVTHVAAGIDEDLRARLTQPFVEQDADLDKLLKELAQLDREIEARKRREEKSRKQGGNNNPNPGVKSYNQSNEPHKRNNTPPADASASAASQARGKDASGPNNAAGRSPPNEPASKYITLKWDNNNKKHVRVWAPPHRKAIELSRPCATCKEDHFDFECPKRAATSTSKEKEKDKDSTAKVNTASASTATPVDCAVADRLVDEADKPADGKQDFH